MSKKIIIIGGPKTGKTTEANKFAESFKVPVKDTESLMHLGWSAQSQVVAGWISESGPWIIEGVATVRGLRKWLTACPGGSLADVNVVYLTAPVVSEELSGGQQSMAKAIATIWNEIHEQVKARGANIEIVRLK